MSNNNSLIFAVLAGAAAGVAIGLLIAPEKGSETQKKITDTAKNLADKILQKAEELIKDSSKKVNG